MKLKILIYSCFFCFFISCSINKPFVNGPLTENNSNYTQIINEDYINVKQDRDYLTEKQNLIKYVHDTTFVNLKEYSGDFVYDLKYATTDNFLKSKVYECDECYLRFKTVNALIKANNYFIKKGLRIKLFDCYRPIDIQKKMWEIVSNPQYVADPRKGSIHNRGGAVDLTLVDVNGKELNMGTPFDFFGVESGHSYENISEEVKKNRELLRNGMTRFNFRIFKSEWWHYNLKNSNEDKLSNFKWKCE